MSQSLSTGHRNVTNFNLFNVTVMKFMVREKRTVSLNFNFLLLIKKAQFRRVRALCKRWKKSGRSRQIRPSPPYL